MKDAYNSTQQEICTSNTFLPLLLPSSFSLPTGCPQKTFTLSFIPWSPLSGYWLVIPKCSERYLDMERQNLEVDGGSSCSFMSMEEMQITLYTNQVSLKKSQGILAKIRRANNSFAGHPVYSTWRHMICASLPHASWNITQNQNIGQC